MRFQTSLNAQRITPKKGSSNLGKISLWNIFQISKTFFCKTIPSEFAAGVSSQYWLNSVSDCANSCKLSCGATLSVVLVCVCRRVVKKGTILVPALPSMSIFTISCFNNVLFWPHVLASPFQALVPGFWCKCRFSMSVPLGLHSPMTIASAASSLTPINPVYHKLTENFRKTFDLYAFCSIFKFYV